MNKVFLSTQAYSNLISLPPRERLFVAKALSQLREKPGLGLKLWGRQDWYLYQTAIETKVVYKLSGRHVQVLAIKAGEESLLPSKARVSAIVLAAGKPNYGDTLPISRVAETFLSAGIDDLIVVLGYHAEQAKKDLWDKDVKIIVNPDYEHGLCSSLRYGLRMVSRDVAGVALTLGNLPYIKPEVVAKLIGIYKRGAAPIIAPTYSQMRGHPVIFDTLLIPELLKVRGNTGGRGVLQHHSRESVQVEVEDAGIIKQVEETIYSRG